jgi:hypothetical protein
MKQRALRACAVLAVAAAVAIGCSSSDDPAPANNGTPSAPVVSQASVGPSGGTVTGDGVTLAIPAGALPADQQISITRTIDAPPTNAIGALYKFGPDGLTFAVPVRVTFTVSAASPDAIVYWSTPNGGYEAKPSEVSGTTVAANIAHFSSGFVGHPSADGQPDAGGGDAGTDTGSDSGDGTSCVCPDGIAGGMCCNGTCVSTSSDPLHCGSCNKVCPSTTPSCVNGMCAAPPAG